MSYLLTQLAEVRHRRRAIPWGLIRLAIGLIFALLLFRIVDWSAFFDLLRRVKPGYVALALSINFINLLLSACRWQILLRSDGVHVPLRRLASYYLVSLFFNNYLPPFVGADAVRMLSMSESKSPGVRIVSVLIERGTGLFVLLLFGAVTVLVNPTLRGYTSLNVLIGAALIAIIGAFCALFFPRTWLWAIGITARIPRLNALLLDIATAGRRYGKRRQALVLTLLISAIIQAFVVLAFQCRALAFGIEIPVEQLLLVVPAITLLTLLPLSPGGIGTQESFFAMMFGMIGINGATSLAMALLARALDVVMGLLGASVWLSGR